MKQESVQQKKLWEVDPEYLIYLRSHHPEAIEFIRKNFAALKDGEQVRKTNSIWLDIQQYTEFSGLDPDKSRLPNTDNVILFRTISFAVFPQNKAAIHRDIRKVRL